MIISVSILNSDLCNIGNTIKVLEKSGIEWLHFDVMDGSFVDNISFGIPVLQSVRDITDMFLDVHLMIENPQRHIKKFAEAGADLITFHLETCENSEKAKEIIEEIHSYGKKAGIAINPETPASHILPFIDVADLLLIMSVEPGQGGQSFMENSLEKLELIKQICECKHYTPHIQVDGGINQDTAKLVKQSGANNLVCGSYITKGLKGDITQQIEYVKKRVESLL
jgi:ribulose-phosphate 3-epimerase